MSMSKALSESAARSSVKASLRIPTRLLRWSCARSETDPSSSVPSRRQSYASGMSSCPLMHGFSTPNAHLGFGVGRWMFEVQSPKSVAKGKDHSGVWWAGGGWRVRVRDAGRDVPFRMQGFFSMATPSGRRQATPLHLLHKCSRGAAHRPPRSTTLLNHVPMRSYKRLCSLIPPNLKGPVRYCANSYFHPSWGTLRLKMSSYSW